jgi:putative PEP-CTERM system histidine kinase
VPGIWSSMGIWGQTIAAFLLSMVAVWLVRRWRQQKDLRPTGGEVALLCALLATGAWSFSIATNGTESWVATFTESVRNLAWLVFLFLLVRSARSQPASLVAIYLTLGAVLGLQTALDLSALDVSHSPKLAALIGATSALLRMLFAVGALVLAHNLYVVASPEARAQIRMPLTALAAMWVFDLNLYTVVYLSGGVPNDMFALRAVITILLVPFFAMAAARQGGWKLTLSRKVAMRSLSLMAIGTYLAIMIAVAQLLRMMGGDIANIAQLGLVLSMSVTALLLLPSARFRAWFKVKTAKHFFKYRYDYRQEWMRFTNTLGRPGDGAAPFRERVIQALADITDSPGGLLLTPNEAGRLELGGRFNWPTAQVPAKACNAGTIEYFRSTGRIIELDVLRIEKAWSEDRAAVPEWMTDEHAAWAIVPLVHFDRLAGLVILTRPIVNRTLDWEDFDLLRVAGRQIASYLAEARSQEALLESEQFDEFNRRFAFVMHDIKNLVSQLSLVARNAERHAHNPEFRADMIATLQNSVGKMKTLIARLTKYARAESGHPEIVDPEELIRNVISEQADVQNISFLGGERLSILADRQHLEQVITHLVQNALDASSDGQPIYIKLSREGMNGRVDIVDNGCGMSPEFIRTKLFKPFISSKTDGFGIGAFEARSLVEAMGGRIDVESREGEGSRFSVYLPLARTIEAPMPEKNAGSRQSPVPEKVRLS